MKLYYRVYTNQKRQNISNESDRRKNQKIGLIQCFSCKVSHQYQIIRIHLSVYL